MVPATGGSSEQDPHLPPPALAPKTEEVEGTAEGTSEAATGAPGPDQALENAITEAPPSFNVGD